VGNGCMALADYGREMDRLCFIRWLYQMGRIWP
jgi:hypothetical protein